MSIGVTLSQQDLEAVHTLFLKRWSASISNWKERNTDYCVWIVNCPDSVGNQITTTGTSLADAIDKILQESIKLR